MSSDPKNLVDSALAFHGPSIKPMVQAARGQVPSRYPIWFMRQAGRYLPEYREIRSKVDFVTLCQTPALATEVTLQPLRRYDLDAAIIFSDILIPAVAMGQTLTFDKGEGPVLTTPVRSEQDLLKLKVPNIERELGFVGEAISKTKAALRADQTMIGFAGAPFTVASYMIEGSSSKNFTEVKKLLLQSPKTIRELLALIGQVTSEYFKMQVQAGADVLMLFDTWAGQITSSDYRQFAFDVTQKLLAGARALGVPVIYFPGQGTDRMFDLQGLDVDVISVDWRTRLSTAARILQDQRINVTLQGNLDPQYLMANKADLENKVDAIIHDAAIAKVIGAKGHIFNVGHGLLPHTPPDALTTVINRLRSTTSAN